MKWLPLFPDTTKIVDDALAIAGFSLASLADEYGTPLYVYDRATLDHSVAGYRASLASTYGAAASITYAGKAYLSKALAQWTQFHNLWVDCTGEGEIAIAKAGAVPRERILSHGVNKSPADLKSALQFAGTIVVDNLDELRRIQLPITNFQSHPSLWLRLLPGLAVETHHTHTQTGQHDSKFGMTREEIVEAARFCREHGLTLNGIHFHQGSNFHDPSPLIKAIELGLDLAREINFGNEWHFSPGGGWGVAYTEEQLPQPNIGDYVQTIAETVTKGCQARGLSLPHLHLEPGRSLVARAGVALYRVGALKRRGDKTWILVDGGMTDNPRYALYGARYACVAASAVSRERSGKASIAGPFCESGDILIDEVWMPEVEVGETIAIPVSGAYQLSMSSNYNGARRPAVVWLEEGRARLIQRRETTDDLLRRDEGL
ncbi:MAG: diaminopimelate decarboxylase [Chloroflexi bacterium]|nr:diaminopimelate decarboxylase [Chloroflexota bacterium]